jgi:predicted nucleotidyltransferase
VEAIPYATQRTSKKYPTCRALTGAQGSWVIVAALSLVADDISFALLYGSVAQRRDTALSDIDVLLVSDRLTLERVNEALAPAEKRLGRPVSPTLYTQAEFHRRLTQRNPFLVTLLAGECVTLLGDRDDFIAAG